MYTCVYIITIIDILIDILITIIVKHILVMNCDNNIVNINVEKIVYYSLGKIAKFFLNLCSIIIR